MSKISSAVGIGFVTLAVAFIAYQQSETTIEDVGERIALKILEILPRKSKHLRSGEFADPPATASPSPPPTGDEAQEEVPLSKQSSFNPVGSYNPKKAMQLRYDGLKEVCMKYSDFMRPERVAMSQSPSLEAVVFHGESQFQFCTLDKVARKSFKTLFFRMKEGATKANMDKEKRYKMEYPKHVKDLKKAIVVRHPLERLVSAYRYNFERSFNAATNENEGGEISFQGFIDIVLHGPVEFAEFLAENKMDGASVAIDTGMIDGAGLSNAWNPYWRECGVCNPLTSPQYILHLATLKQDAEVLFEVMDNPPNAREFAKVAYENKSGLREVEEHYWSQLTKDEIRGLYEKYKLDHELFGFTPDYYIAMGRDNDDDDDDDGDRGQGDSE